MTSPGLTVRAMETQLSTSRHVELSVHQQRGHGSGGVFDISDASGTTMNLLRNVESVYMQSMTTEDAKNKLVREKIQAEDLARRLQDDLKHLNTQLAQEKNRRTIENALSHELASNKILMQDIVGKQAEVKKMHEDDSHMLSELRENSSANQRVLDRLSQEVVHLKDKQTERRKLRAENQRLTLEV